MLKSWPEQKTTTYAQDILVQFLKLPANTQIKLVLQK